ncbi:MAG: Npt1/Npt2 family nucleotide transporter [Cyclonatronaceae bacterium]
MKKIINLFYDIRKGEWIPVFQMFGLHFLLMMVFYFLKPARDSLFLNENGPDDLPYVYILLAVFSIPVAQILTWLMRRYTIRTVSITSLLFLSLNILVIRWFIRFDLHWIYMAFYIWVGIFGILVISLFWILANDVFRPAQSKRIFSFLTLGAILGAILGSQTSSILVSLDVLSTENLLYLTSGLLLLGSAIVFGIRPGLNKEHSIERVVNKSKSSAFGVARYVVKSRYQLMISAIIGLTMITTTFTDYQFKAIAFASYTDKDDLTAFLGMFYAGISLASLLIQILFSNQIIKKLGLTGSILTRPVGMMVGAVMMVIEPVLASVIILNGFDGASRYSIDKTGRELLFLPLPQYVKEQTKIFIDIFVDRFSRGVAGILLLGFIIWLPSPVYSLTFVVIALLMMWIVLGYSAKKEYVRKFRSSVQKQLMDIGSVNVNLNEPSILSIIKNALNSGNSSQILHTLLLLEDSSAEKVTDQLKKLLNHKDRDIKLRALKLLQDVDSINLTEEIELMLSDHDPEIRLETIYYLCKHSSKDPATVIKSYLNNGDYKIKSAAIGCASRHQGMASELVEPDFFDDLISYEGLEAVVIKAQVAEALGYVKEDELAFKYLSKLLEVDQPLVLKKVLESMARQKNDRFIPMIIGKLTDHNVGNEAKQALASYGPEYLVLFKKYFFDEALDSEVRKKIPDVLSLIPNQASADLLFSMISVDEPAIRYHVIKNLNRIKRSDSFIVMNRTVVHGTVVREAAYYFKLMGIKLLQPPQSNQLLLRALDEKMQYVTERIFRLLGLVYDRNDMYGTYLSLQSVSAEKRSAAVEFLDNILSAEDQSIINPIVDYQPDPEKFLIGQKLFNIPEYTYEDGLIYLMENEDRWLNICAIYSVSPQCPGRLQLKVRDALSARDPVIRETAELVVKRNHKILNVN